MGIKEEYISLVLSQIQDLALKRIVTKILHEKIDEMLQNQYFSDMSEDQSIKMVLAELGDPVERGQYYGWLYNLVDLF